MRNSQLVAALWVAFPFLVVGSLALGDGRFTGSPIVAAAALIAIEAAIVMAAIHLVRDRLWARRAFGAAAVVLAIYCGLLGLWMGSFWGPAVVVTCAAGVALGVFTILNMAWVTLQR